jgi:uncharacterized membrane protein
MHFVPIPGIYLLLFALLLVVVITVLRYGIVAYVYERLGLSRRGAVGVLFGALLGSGINIPVAEFPARLVVHPGVVDFFGVPYVIPQVVEQGRTVLAVNVGGAVIPIAVAALLIARQGFTRRVFWALVIVTILIHLLAQPVAGLGVALPPFLPPILVAVTALLVDPLQAPRTAFISGTLGTLIGADLMNLGAIRDLGAPIASIGGAGTFDGIFLVGVFAVLLTALPIFGRRFRRAAPPSQPEAQTPPSDRFAA